MDLVALDLIKDNPYQPRETYDAAEIEKLARSIASDGLLEWPTARRVNGHWELAFGHRRRKAFEWLRDNYEAQGLTERCDGYRVMPLEPGDLNDEEMHRYAVIENVHRVDISPIETAKAMVVQRDQFGKTSDEIGALFGMNSATVRGMIRLLDLPEAAQEALEEGKITQGTARSLLSMQKVAPTVILQTLKEIEDEKKSSGNSRWSNERLPEEVVVDLIEEQPEVVQLCYDGRNKGKPRAKGENGWLLDMKNFPNHHLSALTPVDAAVALGIQDQAKLMERVAAWIEAAIEGNALAVEPTGIPEPLLEKLHHLVNPPACSACPFYTTLRGTHYCGVKTCYERKSMAWDRKMLEDASKKLGIAIYDREADGDFKVLTDLHSWDSDREQALFKKRHKDLRLALMADIDRKKDQYGYEGVPSGSVALVVGKAMQDLQVEKKEERVEKESKVDIEDERVLRQFMLNWEVSAYVQTLFDALNDHSFAVLIEAVYKYNQQEHFLDEIADRVEKSEVTDRRLMAFDMLQQACYPRSATCVKHAEGLMATAKTWGVKIPARFLKLAEQADAEIKELKKAVAVETKKGKSA